MVFIDAVAVFCPIAYYAIEIGLHSKPKSDIICQCLHAAKHMFTNHLVLIKRMLGIMRTTTGGCEVHMPHQDKTLLQ